MSKWVQDASWKRGQGVEAMFGNLLSYKAEEARAADLQEQFSHVDYITDLGKIDVKARKRINRSDDSAQDDLVWLEFKNVQGKVGWLYGKADIIAFERCKDFVLVSRELLAELGEKLCDLEDLVDRGSDALYKGYTRRGRHDLLSIIKMSDILEIEHEIWEKDVDTIIH